MADATLFHVAVECPVCGLRMTWLALNTHINVCAPPDRPAAQTGHMTAADEDAALAAVLADLDEVDVAADAAFAAALAAADAADAATAALATQTAQALFVNGPGVSPADDLVAVEDAVNGDGEEEDGDEEEKEEAAYDEEEDIYNEEQNDEDGFGNDAFDDIGGWNASFNVPAAVLPLGSVRSIGRAGPPPMPALSDTAACPVCQVPQELPQYALHVEACRAHLAAAASTAGTAAAAATSAAAPAAMPSSDTVNDAEAACDTASTRSTLVTCPLCQMPWAAAAIEDHAATCGEVDAPTADAVGAGVAPSSALAPCAVCGVVAAEAAAVCRSTSHTVCSTCLDHALTVSQTGLPPCPAPGCEHPLAVLAIEHRVSSHAWTALVGRLTRSRPPSPTAKSLQVALEAVLASDAGYVGHTGTAAPAESAGPVGGAPIWSAFNRKRLRAELTSPVTAALDTLRNVLHDHASWVPETDTMALWNTDNAASVDEAAICRALEVRQVLRTTGRAVMARVLLPILRSSLHALLTDLRLCHATTSLLEELCARPFWMYCLDGPHPDAVDAGDLGEAMQHQLQLLTHQAGNLTKQLGRMQEVAGGAPDDRAEASMDTDLDGLAVTLHLRSLPDTFAECRFLFCHLLRNRAPAAEHRPPRTIAAAASTVAGAAPAPLGHAPAVTQAVQDAYVRQLCGLHAFCYVDQLADVASTPAHAAIPTRSGSQKLMRELASLEADLPIEWASAIFVRAQESRFNVMKALIIGPEGTPYENGCFLFDIVMPPNYPHVPPSVTFRTTANNSVRFNPNLYRDGKVCLSLLGTWHGPGWQPNQSTLLQVLMSITSQVLNDTPLRNEPSLQNVCQAECTKYNLFVRALTAKVAILDAIPTGAVLPSGDGLDAVVATHLRLKRAAILAQIHRWMTDDPHSEGFQLPEKRGVSSGFMVHGLDQLRGWSYPRLYKHLEAKLATL